MLFETLQLYSREVALYIFEARRWQYLTMGFSSRIKLRVKCPFDTWALMTLFFLT
jgi:hypothetical protein